MNRTRRFILLTAGTLAVGASMVYVDVWLRARHSYQEGEKYWRWSEHPEERAAYLAGLREAKEADLKQRLEKGGLRNDDFDFQMKLAAFDYEQSLKESSIKNAYFWYQTTVELFSPPESKWVHLAREKMPLAKARWVRELKAQGIPFENYMLE